MTARGGVVQHSQVQQRKRGQRRLGKKKKLGVGERLGGWEGGSFVCCAGLSCCKSGIWDGTVLSAQPSERTAGGFQSNDGMLGGGGGSSFHRYRWVEARYCRNVPSPVPQKKKRGACALAADRHERGVALVGPGQPRNKIAARLSILTWSPGSQGAWARLCPVRASIINDKKEGTVADGAR